MLWKVAAPGPAGPAFLQGGAGWGRVGHGGWPGTPVRSFKPRCSPLRSGRIPNRVHRKKVHLCRVFQLYSVVLPYSIPMDLYFVLVSVIYTFFEQWDKPSNLRTNRSMALKFKKKKHILDCYGFSCAMTDSPIIYPRTEIFGTIVYNDFLK